MSTIRVDRITPYQSGSVAIESLSISNLEIEGTLTASIQEGYVLVGGSGNVSTLAATSSFGGGDSTDITALNSYTESADGRISNLESTTSSLEGQISSLNSFTSSYNSGSFTGSFVGDGSGLTGVGSIIDTSSFATTGSNVFIGTQTISGSILVSGSINSDGYELEASSTETIPVLNDSFDLDFSGSIVGITSTFIEKSLVLGDGKILVAGRFTTVDGHATNDIARLNSDGTLDTSFSAPIFSGSNFAGGDAAAWINTFVTQSDDKILVGGNFVRVDGGVREGIARLNTDGTLDTTFVTQSFIDFSTSGGVRDIVIQDDAKILFVGDFTSGSRRVNTDGTLDTSFDIGREAVAQFNNQPLAFNNGEFYSVALLDSGSEQAVLIGGSFTQWGSFSNYNHLVKLNHSGALDFDFAGADLDIITGNSSDRIEKIKVGDDGYIYVAGRFRDTGIGNNAGFARITTTDEGNGVGAINTSLRTYISGSFVNDFDFYDGDKILLGGSFTLFGNPAFSVTSANRFAIIRQSTGGLVSNWSTDGLASKYNLNTGSVNSVTLLPNDNVLVGGSFTSASFPSTAREGLASLKLTGFGDVTTTIDYSITADTNELLISSSNTRFSGDITASVISGSFVGDGSGLQNLPAVDTFPYTGNAVISGSITISGSILQTGIGENNTIIGSGSGTTPAGSVWNTFIGANAGQSNIAGADNTFIGAETGKNQIGGLSNTFVGSSTGTATISGDENSFLGAYSGEANTSGYNNTFIGKSAGSQNTEGFSNTFVGRRAGSGNILGLYNVAIGAGTGTTLGSYNGSIFIGDGANPQANLQDNQIVIGRNAVGNGSNTTTIGNSSTTATYLRGALNLTHITSPHIVSGSLILSGSETISGSLNVSGSMNVDGSVNVDGSGYIVLLQLSASQEYADDFDAAAGGVPLGGLYRDGGNVRIRIV